MTEYEKRGYLLENFRLFHLRSESGAKVDFHYHEFCKILLLVSGRGSYFVEGRRYALSPGDVVLIGSRSVHKPELEADTPYERIIIYISPEYLQRLSTADCDLLSVFSGGEGHVLRPREQQRKQLFSLAAAFTAISVSRMWRFIAARRAILNCLTNMAFLKGRVVRFSQMG